MSDIPMQLTFLCTIRSPDVTPPPLGTPSDTLDDTKDVNKAQEGMKANVR